MEESQAQADVCVVCALAEEAKAFLEVAQQVHQVIWSSRFNMHGYEYQHATILNENEEPLNLHVSWLARPDATTMTHHLSRVVETAQPRFVVMPGICAGDQRQVHLGDLVIAERTFTYDTGKFTTDEHGQQVHLHDTLTTEPPATLLQYLRLFETWKPRVTSLDRPISLRRQRDWLLYQLLSTPSVRDIPQATLDQNAPEWRQVVHTLQQEPDALLSETLVLHDTQAVEQLHYGPDPFPFQDPSEAQCHIAALASGNAVRQDDPFQEIQVPVRGAIAVDLQGAAFGRVMHESPTIPWLIVKGIANYATKNKDETYRGYAARVSAHYALRTIEEYVTQERLPRKEQMMVPALTAIQIHRLMRQSQHSQDTNFLLYSLKKHLAKRNILSWRKRLIYIFIMIILNFAFIRSPVPLVEKGEGLLFFNYEHEQHSAFVLPDHNNIRKRAQYIEDASKRKPYMLSVELRNESADRVLIITRIGVLIERILPVPNPLRVSYLEDRSNGQLSEENLYRALYVDQKPGQYLDTLSIPSLEKEFVVLPPHPFRQQSHVYLPAGQDDQINIVLHAKKPVYLQFRVGISYHAITSKKEQIYLLPHIYTIIFSDEHNWVMYQLIGGSWIETP